MGHFLWNGDEVDEEIRLSGSRGTKVNTLFRSLFQNPILELSNSSELEGIPNRTLRRLIDEYVEKGFLVELNGSPAAVINDRQ